MPSLSDVRTAYNQVLLDVAQAWPDVTKVYAGRPRKATSDLTYAVVELRPAPGEWEAAREMQWSLVFDIVLVEPVLADKMDVLVFHKMDRVDSFAAVVEAEPDYAGVGMYPVVQEFDLGERGDEDEDVMETSVSLSMRVMREWGT